MRSSRRFASCPADVAAPAAGPEGHTPVVPNMGRLPGDHSPDGSTGSTTPPAAAPGAGSEGRGGGGGGDTGANVNADAGAVAGAGAGAGAAAAGGAATAVGVPPSRSALAARATLNASKNLVAISLLANRDANL